MRLKIREGGREQGCTQLTSTRGGTFTDGYIVGDARRLSVKVETTPHDLTVCFYNCIEEAARRLALDMDELLDRTRIIRFSSTIATNTAVQLSGPKLGVIVTDGNQDTLYSNGRENPVSAFLSPGMVVGIAEEIDRQGNVNREPSAEEVDEKVRFLLENGARTLIISLRNSHANPANENLIRRYIDSSYPRHYLGAVPMLLSHQVTRVPDDALRTNTAIVNGYFHRELVRTLYKAEDIVRRKGYRYPLMIATADYGLARVAKTKAINTYQSGPASGVRGAHVLSQQLRRSHILTVDVGGTTTDVSFIADGQPVGARFRPIMGAEVAQRIPDIVSFGLGGGSRIGLGENRKIEVGPDSQGAVPGPACFGLGGSAVTPTDVWLALGYLAPDRYLGGRKKLQRDKALAVIEKGLAQPLGITVEQAALAAKDAVEEALAQHIAAKAPLPDGARLEGSTLCSVGGGAGLLAIGLAEKLKLGSVYFPINAAVFSAFGASTLDVSHSYEEILPVGSNGLGDVSKGDILDRLKDQAVRDMRGEGFGSDRITFLVEAECYAGQQELGRAAPRKAAGKFPAQAGAVLDRPPDGTEYIIVRLTAACAIPRPQYSSAGQRAESAQAASPSSRHIGFGQGAEEVPVYRFDLMALEARIEGPAIVEDDHTSILLPEGHEFRMDDLGNGIVEL